MGVSKCQLDRFHAMGVTYGRYEFHLDCKVGGLLYTYPVEVLPYNTGWAMMVQLCIYLAEINPRRMRHRVSVVVLCVCLSVCLLSSWLLHTSFIR